ncbi:MAG: hypothetical protein WBV61_12430, partial [Rhodanobacteraceae bacterium]
PGLPDRVCRGLAHFGRGRELAVLLRHPRIAARLAWQGALDLDPWLARDIGQVEGRDFAQIPPTTPSVGKLLHASSAFRILLLVFPFATLLWLAVRRRWRTTAFEFAALTVVLMGMTFGVTILGDGLADTAKQGHLIINAALALLICVLVCAVLPKQPNRSPSNGDT